MTEKKELTVICQQFDAVTALQRIASIAGDVSGTIEQKLLYPYFHFTAHCTVPTMIGRRAITVECLVDGINGTGATADPFASEKVMVPDEMRLLPGVTEGAAARIARGTVTHELGRKLRMIAPFDVTLESSETIYRGFWVLGIGGGRIMLDSVTGGMHTLSATAA